MQQRITAYGQSRSTKLKIAQLCDATVNWIVKGCHCHSMSVTSDLRFINLLKVAVRVIHCHATPQ